MKIGILSVAVFLLCSCPAWGQTEVVSVRQVTGNDKVVFPDAMKGTVKGVVTSPDGSPIAGANVTVTKSAAVSNSFNCVSKRDGHFSLVFPGGNCFVDVTAPGYERQIVEMVVASQSVAERNFVLSPKDGAVVDGAARGNRIVCSNSGFQMTPNASHPAYEGCTLLDAVCDMPAVDPFSTPATVMHNELFEVMVNGNAVRVSPDKMRDYFRSIPIGKVKSLKVVSGNVFTGEPAFLYIVVNE